MLTVGRQIFVGLTTRSNQPAIDQMQAFMGPYGYSVHAVAVSGCLHLKSAVTQATSDTLLINPAWVDKLHFPGMKFIEVDPSEPSAANILMVAGQVLYQPCFPRTLARLEAEGLHPILVDASELGKAEGALTCCSLIFNRQQAAGQGSIG